MSQEGILKTVVDSDKMLFTLLLPAQPQVGREPIRPAEIQLLAFADAYTGFTAIRNAFTLLEVLYGRGVTDSGVLALILEATGHPQNTEPALHPPSGDSASATEEGTRDRS